MNKPRGATPLLLALLSASLWAATPAPGFAQTRHKTTKPAKVTKAKAAITAKAAPAKRAQAARKPVAKRALPTPKPRTAPLASRGGTLSRRLVPGFRRPQTALPDIAGVGVPAPVREFRGVWAASVENIDWPSRVGLSPDRQKAELLLLLDRAKQANLNAVLLQVRPSCDALYQSDLEPWSEFLTGQMGKAPYPAYDPLAFAVDEAHKRGLELHAWFNPFRARAGGKSKSTASANHVSRTHPEWVRTYGNLAWLDPGEKGARDYSLAVILDVVSRYDVDGVHIDDYFYPYKISGPNKRDLPFPDDVPWKRYVAGGGALSRDDWRRANIDEFVQKMYQEVKNAKPWVKVGISPFGIWRPGNPPQIKGFDSYAELYGDSRKWMHEGWADYFTPQLYWPIAQKPQSFPVLLHWWAGENAMNRHLWPGLYTSQANGARAKWPRTEVEYQIKTTRGQAASTGDIHFSARFLLDATIATPNGLARHLRETVYREPALIPASPWLAPVDAPLPTPPENLTALPRPDLAQVGWTLQWRGTNAQNAPFAYVVQWADAPQNDGEALIWHQEVVSGTQAAFFIPAFLDAPAPFVATVSAVNRVGAVSVPVRVGLFAPP